MAALGSSRAPRTDQPGWQGGTRGVVAARKMPALQYLLIPQRPTSRHALGLGAADVANDRGRTERAQNSRRPPFLITSNPRQENGLRASDATRQLATPMEPLGFSPGSSLQRRVGSRDGRSLRGSSSSGRPVTLLESSMLGFLGSVAWPGAPPDAPSCAGRACWEWHEWRSRDWWARAVDSSRATW